MSRIGASLQVDGLFPQVAIEAGDQLQAEDAEFGIEALLVRGRKRLVQLGSRLIGQGARTGEVAAQLLDAGQLRQREALHLDVAGRR